MYSYMKKNNQRHIQVLWNLKLMHIVGSSLKKRGQSHEYKIRYKDISLELKSKSQ